MKWWMTRSNPINLKKVTASVQRLSWMDPRVPLPSLVPFDPLGKLCRHRMRVSVGRLIGRVGTAASQ